MNPLTKFVLLFSIMILGCPADLKTKEVVNKKIKGTSIEIIEDCLNFTYTENHAIAFGMFQSVERKWRMPLIFALPIGTTLFLFFIIWRSRKFSFRLLLPLFIILSGAYGNIIDRAIHGYVTDFIHIHYQYQHSFYAFNIADILVNLGLILILLQYRDFGKLLDQVYQKNHQIGLS